jgi:Tol biopolymer transport system component
MHPRVSSDGSRLVFGRDDAGGSDIWMYELAGTTEPQRLTFDGHSRFPIWAGDSKRVLFQSDRESAQGIYLLSVDGSHGAERITTASDAESHMPESFSSLGGRLLYTVEKNGIYSLRTMTLTDRKAEPFSHVQTRDPIGAVYSPDGRWVAYALNETGGGGNSPNRGVYVEPVPATGAKYQLPRTALDFHPAWSPDSRELFYVPSSFHRVVAVPFRTQPDVTFGAPVDIPNGPLPGFLSLQVRGYDVLPDGRFISLVGAAEQAPSGAAILPELRVVLNWFEELKRLTPTR